MTNYIHSKILQTGLVNMLFDIKGRPDWVSDLKDKASNNVTILVITTLILKGYAKQCRHKFTFPDLLSFFQVTHSSCFTLPMSSGAERFSLCKASDSFTTGCTHYTKFKLSNFVLILAKPWKKKFY